MPPRKPKPVAATGGAPATASRQIEPTSTATSRSKPADILPTRNTVPAESADDESGMDGWEELNRKKWRGLGLSDPIKTVEVSFIGSIS